MRKKLLALVFAAALLSPYFLNRGTKDLLASTFSAEENISIDENHFPDPVFREKVREFDANKDGILTRSERDAAQVFSCAEKNVKSLKGLEYFTEARAFSCFGNELTELDVSHNTKLTELYCSNNKLTSLDLSHNPDLKELGCSNNNIAVLDLSHCPKLVELVQTATRQEKDGYMYFYEKSDPVWMSLYYDKTTQLSVDGNIAQPTPAPTPVPAPEQLMTPIDEQVFPDISLRTKVSEFDQDRDNHLSESEIRLISKLDISRTGVEDLKGLSLLTNLEALVCDGNQISNLDFAGNSRLTYISCSDNPIQTINVSRCPELKTLNCADCRITELDVSANYKLEKLVCSRNRLTSLDISHNPSITELECEGNEISSLDIRNCRNLDDLIASVEGTENTEGEYYDFISDSPSSHLRYDKSMELISANTAKVPSDAEPEDIDDEKEEKISKSKSKETKKSSQEKTWSLVDIILVVAAAGIAVLTILKKKHEHEYFGLMVTAMILSCVIAIGGGVFFFVTQDISSTMTKVDIYTLIFATFPVGNIVMFALRFIRKSNVPSAEKAPEQSPKTPSYPQPQDMQQYPVQEQYYPPQTAPNQYYPNPGYPAQNYPDPNQNPNPNYPQQGYPYQDPNYPGQYYPYPQDPSDHGQNNDRY